jgi:hypothetical protein
MVSSSCSTTTSVLPLSLRVLCSGQQDLVVARVQADGGLVQHVAHALQVAAQLRGQADALRLAAAERGRAPVQREVAQADLFQEFQPGGDFGDQVAGDLGLAARQRQGFDPATDVGDRQAGQVGDGPALTPALSRQRERETFAPSQGWG